MLQVTVDAIMLPSQLSNCQEDVDQFLLTLGNLDEAAQPPAQPPNPSAEEDLPQEALELLSFSVSSGIPSKALAISDVNIVAYISGYIVRKRRNRFCASCQEKLTSRIDASKPSHLFLSLKAHADAKEGLVAPSPELHQLVQDLECTYRSVFLNILHMNCVRARLIRRLMQVAKTGTVECSGNECEPKQLIVGLFVNIRLHHSLKEATESLNRNKVRKNRKQMKFSHC
jgi:hypothetical protein